MPTYRLDIMERPEKALPEEHYRQQHEFIAADDTAAIALAHRRYQRLAQIAALDSFVLYEGGRVVHEFVGSEPGREPG